MLAALGTAPKHLVVIFAELAVTGLLAINVGAHELLEKCEFNDRFLNL